VEAASSTSFTDKLNTIVVAWKDVQQAPTLASVRSAEIPLLERSERAFELVKVSAVKVPAARRFS